MDARTSPRRKFLLVMLLIAAAEFMVMELLASLGVPEGTLKDLLDVSLLLVIVAPFIYGFARTGESLRESEGKFRSLVEESLVGVYIIQGGRTVYANPRIAKISGYSQDELAGRDVLDYIFPEDRDAVSKAMDALEKGETESAYVQYRVTAKDGSVLDVEALGAKTMYKGRQAIIGTLVEITKRKKLEAAALRYGRQVEVLASSCRDINREREASAIIRRLVSTSMELVGASSGAAGLLKDGEVVFTEYNKDGGIIKADFSFGPGQGTAGRVLETLKPYATADAAHDPVVSREARSAFGLYGSVAAVPIMDRGGSLKGCLELYNKAGGLPFDLKDLEMMESLAASAAIALENAEMFNRRP